MAGRLSHRCGSVVGRILRGLLAVACVGALAAVFVGCRQEPKAISATLPMVEPAEKLETLLAMINSNDRLWFSLEARCSVIVQNRQITAPNNQVVFERGRLLIQKPRRIYLNCSSAGGLSMTLVGDGQRYSVSMPAFDENYSGRYGEPIPNSVRIPFMPDDLADAFDHTKLFVDKVLMQTQGQVYSTIYSALLLGDVEPEPKIAHMVTAERRRGRFVFFEKFNIDGTTRMQAQFLRHQTLRTLVSPREEGEAPQEKPVDIPISILFRYPHQAGTSIMLHLTDVRLNQPLDEKMFAVPR